MSDDEDEDFPSAPPFCGSTQEIRQTNEEIPTYAARSTLNKAESSTLKSVSRDKLENHGDASSEKFVRLVIALVCLSILSSLPCSYINMHDILITQLIKMFSN